MNGEDLTGGLKTAWAGFVAFAPKVVLALVILVVGYIVARLIGRVLANLLRRVGFEKVAERGGAKRVLQGSQFDASGLLARIIYYALMVMVLQLAFGVFGPNPISALLNDLIAFLPKLFAALLIVVVASAVASMVKDLLQGLLSGLSYGRLLANVAGGFIVATGIFAGLSQISIAPAIVNGLYYALLAILAGSAIVAIGGGGIGPMRAQWEKLMARMAQEAQQRRQGAAPVIQEMPTPRSGTWPESTENGPKKN
jgi:hypothetical protein